jgi:hypothetical protein
VAAVGYMFAGKWLLHLLAGGHTILAPLAWLPLAVLLLDGAVRRGSFLRATAAGTAFALVVLGTHPQVTFYAGLFLAVWTLGPALERAGYLGAGPGQRSARPIVTWAVLGAWAAVVAVALSAVQLLPALEAAPETTRAAGVEAPEPGTQVVPVVLLFAGPSLTEPHWEPRGNFGLLWLAAAALAPLLRRGIARFQAAVCLLLLLFAVGGGLLVQHLPGFRLFQLPVRMLLIAALPVALLAGTAVQALRDLPADAAATRRRARRVAAAVLAGCVVLLGLQVLLLKRSGPFSWLPYGPLLLLTVPAGYWLLSRPAASAPRLWAAVAVVTLTADVWGLSWPLVATRPEAEIYDPSRCVNELVARKGSDPGPWRVLDRGLPGYPSSGPLGVALPPLGDVALEPVQGYNTFDVRRTKQYLALAAGSDEPVRPRQGAFGYAIIEPFLIDNKQFLDLLGVRYLLLPKAAMDGQLPREELEKVRPQLLKGHEGRGEPWNNLRWEPVGEDDAPAVYSFLQGGRVALPPQVIFKNTDVFPRAFVVPRAEPLPVEKDVLAALRSADLRQTVFLEGHGGSGSPPTGQFRPAEVVESRPNRVTVRPGPGPAGYLVLADVWFPGWTCTVDGRAAPLYRADYLFRAVELPEGAREVVFAFEPASYRLGRIISAVALGGVLVLFLLGGLWIGSKGR